MKVCIVTPDIAGPIRNGGIGTACAAIARLLARRGLDVTILYALGDYTETEPLDVWQRRYAEEDISLVACPDNEDTIEPYADIGIAWRVLRWLEGRQFDLLYIVEWGGTGGLVALARREGLGFRDTLLVAGTHSPTLWHLEGQRRLSITRDALARDYLERMTVAYADVVVSPSQHLLEWMQTSGWHLPTDIRVIPNPVPDALRKIRPRALESRPITEFVFFGRLEPRKGLLIFVHALGFVRPDLLSRVRITFLGKVPAGRAEFDARAYLGQAMPAQVRWTIMDDLDTTQAVAYLSADPGRLAVMPSLTENSPMTVVECLAGKIPFLASDVGGIPDLLHQDDHATHLFRPTPPELARVLGRTLSQGLGPAAWRWSADEIDAAWTDTLAAVRSAPSAPSCTIRINAPRVSVVLVHHNRPQMLSQALRGLRTQTFRDFEVIVVDDGSDQPEAIEFLSELEAAGPEFVSGQWRIIRRENGYLGAARNTGWRTARGQYVLFHDDDNVSMEQLLEVLVDVADYCHADVVTSAMVVFSGSAYPDATALIGRRQIWVPLGGAISLGAFENCFGDAHALVRRDILEMLGGFSEDYGVGHEDWEFFAHACLNGCMLVAVPIPLFWYRISPDSMLRSRTLPEADYLRSARPYLDALPPNLRPILLRGLTANLESAIAHGNLVHTARHGQLRGDGKTPESFGELDQSIRDATLAAYTSSSLRLTRALGNFWAQARGIPPQGDASNPASSSVEEFRTLLRLYNSTSWDLMAPIRLVARFWRWYRRASA